MVEDGKGGWDEKNGRRVGGGGARNMFNVPLPSRKQEEEEEVKGGGFYL